MITNRVPSVTALTILMALLTLANNACLATDAGTQLPSLSSDRLSRINPVMQTLVDDGKLPGVLTLVYHNGNISHFEVRGKANIATGQPLQKDTIFRIYSMTKPVTAVAAMILFEEGRFLLDDPVSKYLPEFSKLQVYKGMNNGKMETKPAQAMTIHHLLTHTSGIIYPFRVNQSPVAELYRQASITGGSQSAVHADLAGLIRSLAEQPLQAQPGSEWNYGMSLDVMGRVIEVISGQSLSEFMAQRIFVPLKMVDTGFHVPDDKIQRFAANYRVTIDGGFTLQDDPTQSFYRKPPQIFSGGSGLVSTAADYLRFARMLVNGGSLEGVQILSPKTTALITANHLRSQEQNVSMIGLIGHAGPGRAWGMGFGLGGSVVTNPALLGLPVSTGVYGWAGAASTNFWIDPEEHLVGIVMTQLIPDRTPAIA